MKFWNELKAAMLSNPTQLLCEGEAQLTYSEAVAYAEQFSHRIVGNSCCAIFCQSELNAALSLLACFAADVTAVPVSSRYGEAHCQKILAAISPSAIISDRGGQHEVVQESHSTYIPPLERPALIMCTSGTTGTPKGAMLTKTNICTNVNDICHYLDIGAEDRILIARPLYHCAVLTGEFLVGLRKGAQIRFYSDKFNPSSILGLIRKHNITVFGGTPTLLGAMARFSKEPVPLRAVCVSGECMRKETGIQIADAFPDAKIYHVYGLTEACPRVAYLPPRLFREKPDSVGIPLRSVFLRIMKNDCVEAKNGEEGILYVKGGNVMAGYYNAPEETASVLKNGWLRTGDIALMDEDCWLHIRGRADDLIIRGGMNIYPAEVENSLKASPKVRDVLVYQIEHPEMGVQIGMKIAGEFESTAEVKQLCIALLPSYQVPTHIELLSELPKNGSGKLIRKKMEAR